MNTNKITIIFSIIAILLIISIPTIYNVITNHHNNLYRVVEEKIINSAKKCYYEEKCTNQKITLKELYEFNYLDKVSDPITKEYYADDSYIERKENIFTFYPLE